MDDYIYFTRLSKYEIIHVKCIAQCLALIHLFNKYLWRIYHVPEIVVGLHKTYSINMCCMHLRKRNEHHLSAHYHSHLSGNRMLSLFYVVETTSEVVIKKFANLTGCQYCSCFVIISHLFGTEDLLSLTCFLLFTVSVCLPTSVCKRCPQSKEATERTGKPLVSNL